MKTKGDAHEDFLLLFQRTGVPDQLIMDGFKEQVLILFKNNCSEAGCILKQIEPYYSQQNATEGTIRELKHGSGRNIKRSHIPNKLWNHCLEMEGLICSHNVLGIFKL